MRWPIGLWLCTTFLAISYCHLIVKDKSYKTADLPFLKSRTRWANISTQLTHDKIFKNGSFSHQIVLASFRPGSLVEPNILRLQRQGALAVVLKDVATPGKVWFDTNHKDHQVEIPVASIAAKDFDVIFDIISGDPNNVMGHLHSEDNPWIATLGSVGYGLAAQMVLFVWSAGNTMICFAYLIMYKIDKRCTVSIDILIFVLEFIANLIRILQSVDLFSCRRLYHPAFTDVFNRIAYPFAFGSFILMALHWYNVLSFKKVLIHAVDNRNTDLDPQKAITNNTITRIVFVVGLAALVVLVSAAELVNFMVTGLMGDIVELMFIAFFALIGIFYAATTVRIISIVRPMRNSPDKTAIKKAAYCALAVGVIIMFLSIYIVLFLSSLKEEPVAYCIIVTSFTALLFLASSLQICCVIYFFSSRGGSQANPSSSKFGGESYAGESSAEESSMDPYPDCIATAEDQNV